MSITLSTVVRRYPVAYRVHFEWCTAGTAPETHTSNAFFGKQEAWDYVRTVQARAARAGVTLHRISVLAELNTGDTYEVWHS